MMTRRIRTVSLNCVHSSRYGVDEDDSSTILQRPLCEELPLLSALKGIEAVSEFFTDCIVFKITEATRNQLFGRDASIEYSTLT